jgi:hypothetical protein
MKTFQLKHKSHGNFGKSGWDLMKKTGTSTPSSGRNPKNGYFPL